LEYGIARSSLVFTTAVVMAISYVDIYCFLSVICNSHIIIGVCDQF
jgi:hypothetical protein